MNDKNLLKVVSLFFVSGALVGFLFVWLISIPTSGNFWYDQGNQFLIPKATYWVVFGALLAVGLAVSCCICILRGWLLPLGHGAKSRSITATLILLLAFPAGHITGSRLLGFIDPMPAYFLACLVGVLIISIALWLVSLTWKTWLTIVFLLAIPVSYILTIGLYKSLNLSNHAYDVLRLGFLGGLLSGISGYWLATTRTYSAKASLSDASLLSDPNEMH